MALHRGRQARACAGVRVAVGGCGRPVPWLTASCARGEAKRHLRCGQAPQPFACRAALLRYTGLDFATPRDAKRWLAANRDYLHFSDSEGFVFKVDEEAKRRQIPFARLRGWSSEEIDYRVR